jgi:hypothetical protein
MRTRVLAAGITAALLVAAAPAFAFQESPEAPPQVLQVAPDTKGPAMQLQTPAPAQAPAQQNSDNSGTKLFGFTLFPKLNFGLELLYGSPREMDMQQGTLPENNEDLTVFGTVKRQF